jgi:hypothetical protein
VKVCRNIGGPVFNGEKEEDCAKYAPLSISEW